MVEEVLCIGMVPLVLMNPEYYRFIIKSVVPLPEVLGNYCRFINLSYNFYYRVFRSDSLEGAYDELLVLLRILLYDSVCSGIEFHSVYNVSMGRVLMSKDDVLLSFIHMVHIVRPVSEHELSVFRDLSKRSGGMYILDELVLSVDDDYSIL